MEPIEYAKLKELEDRIAALERRLGQLSANNSTTLVIRDKEYERVLHEMHIIAGTYASHQEWRKADRVRYRQLQARKLELMKILEVTA